ncbi:glycosyltransferase family 2 protein [Polaribacter sp. SA4-12]|uniref:glycosyltransferase family 2 protein n=1 Tax=Polaribacter sp. SA4-12 TaxID=1312072 RepID=UPI000B3CD669|nr:glycosyltransferase family A protein [Polaribacter sp. SA4-12]ARV13803.1 hypothetical protein BTO07_00990 [Polaribacter sp. SA4-12]
MVSIIIPVFNRAHIIEETLKSIISQTSKDWECILVDDGSNDSIETILDKYINIDVRFKFYKRPPNRLKGPSSCRNIGIEKSKGEYIMFLDSDDILANFCIQDRLNTFNKYLNLDFIVFKMNTFFNEIPILESEILQERVNEDYFFNFIELRSSWQVTSPIYKKNIIKKIGGFEEGLSIFEDLLLASKILFNSNNYLVFNNVDCFYRNNNDYFKKHKDISYSVKVVDSFFKLLEYESNLLNKESNLYRKRKLKKSIFKAYVSIFNTYVIPNFLIFKEKNNEIIDYLFTKKIIQKNKKIKLKLVNNLLKYVHKIKGLGVFRLVNLFIK